MALPPLHHCHAEWAAQRSRLAVQAGGVAAWLHLLQAAGAGGLVRSGNGEVKRNAFLKAGLLNSSFRREVSVQEACDLKCMGSTRKSHDRSTLILTWQSTLLRQSRLDNCMDARLQGSQRSLQQRGSPQASAPWPEPIVGYCISR